MPNYYYGANDGDEIIQLIKLGAENIQLEKDINLTSALVIDHNLSIDLNNHKLTYSNDTQVVIDNGIEVEFKAGEMDFIKTKTCVTSSLKVQGGASLILDDVDYISSGTNVAAAIKLAQKLGPGKTVVTLLPDTAERYFSTPLFDGE